MPNKSNRATTQAHDGQVIVGIMKDLQNVPSLPMGGDTYTPTSLVAFFQSRIDAAHAVAIAKAQYQAAMTTYEAINTKGVVVARGLKQYVQNAFGVTSTLLADFGYTPPERTTQTPEQKAAAVAKRKATRDARGTKGPKAKLAVTGETVKLAALVANQNPAVPQAATPAAAPAPLPAPVPVPTNATAPAPQPAPANGAPPAATPPKA